MARTPSGPKSTSLRLWYALKQKKKYAIVKTFIFPKAFDSTSVIKIEVKNIKI